MSTLRQRHSAAIALQAITPDSCISYDIVCSLSDELPIDSYPTLQEAREQIAAINEEYIATEGRGIRMYIMPVVINKYTGELV